MVRRLSILLILSSFTMSSLNSISPIQAQVAALAAGAVGGTLAYKSNARATDTKQIIATVLTAGAVSAIGYYIASRFTPINRYQRAMDQFSIVAGDELLVKNFKSYQDLKQYLQLSYPVDWYLVAGKKRLFKLFDKLCFIDDMLKYVQSEASTSPQLIELCKTAEAKIPALWKKYEQVLPLIESDPVEYHQQRRHYDAFLKRKALFEAESREELQYWGDFTQREQLYRQKIEAYKHKLNKQ